MSLWTRLFGGAEARHQLVSGEYDNWGSTSNPANGLIEYLRGGKTIAGTDINEWIAEGMPAVYACTRAISETVGQTPLKLYQRTNDGRVVADEHPLYLLLHDLPNPEMTAFQFKELMTRNLAMWGRAYAYIQRDASGEVVALWPLEPSRMYVERDELNRKVFKYWLGNGQYQEWVYNPDRPPVMHLHMNSCTGLDGRSPILINRESLGITKAAEDYVGAWFGNGAIPGLIAKHPGRLSDKAKENLRKSWWSKFGGATKANKMAILEEGIEVQVVGVDPQKSQLTELRDAQVAAACRIWRVPSFIVQNHTKDTSWGSGIDSQMIFWRTTGLQPYYDQWEGAVTRDLLSRKTYKTHYAKFVTSAIERGDLKTRFEAYGQAITNGIASANEIREMEEMNRVAGGDVYLIPSGAQVKGPDGMPIAPAPAADSPDTASVRLKLEDKTGRVM